MPVDIVIAAAVEGIVDEAVVRRLIKHAGATPGEVYGKNGKQSLRRKIRGYNNAARRAPWIIVVDLDQNADCAPPLRAEWFHIPGAEGRSVPPIPPDSSNSQRNIGGRMKPPSIAKAYDERSHAWKGS